MTALPGLPDPGYAYAVMGIGDPAHIIASHSGMDRLHPYSLRLGPAPISSALYLSEDAAVAVIRGLFDFLAEQNPARADEVADSLVTATIEATP